MLLAGVYDNAGLLMFAWTHDVLGISMSALDACTHYWQTVSISS